MLQELGDALAGEFSLRGGAVPAADPPLATSPGGGGLDPKEAAGVLVVEGPAAALPPDEARRSIVRCVSGASLGSLGPPQACGFPSAGGSTVVRLCSSSSALPRSSVGAGLLRTHSASALARLSPRPSQTQDVAGGALLAGTATPARLTSAPGGAVTAVTSLPARGPPGGVLQVPDSKGSNQMFAAASITLQSKAGASAAMGLAAMAPARLQGQAPRMSGCPVATRRP